MFLIYKMMRLPPAPMTNEVPSLMAGQVQREHVKMPPAFAHSGPVGLFGDDATIPLVKPSGRDLHPRMPLTSKVEQIHTPMPSIPRDLIKGLKKSATKPVFGMVKIEAHSKKNVPVLYRG